MKFLEFTYVILLDTNKDILTSHKNKKLKKGFKVLKESEEKIGLSKKVMYKTQLYKVTNRNF